MIITFRETIGFGELPSKSRCKNTYTFELCDTLAEDKKALVSSTFLVDIKKETKEKLQDLNLHNFRKALVCLFLL